MVTCQLVEKPDLIKQFRHDYLQALTGPTDGMWEKAIIPQATLWAILEQGQNRGYFCLDERNDLLRFFVRTDDQDQAKELFRWVIATQHIRYAIVSTIEPLYFALCQEYQSRVEPYEYLFRDARRISLPLVINDGVFRRAVESEIAELVRFYHANTEGPGDWIESFLWKRLEHEELYVLCEGSRLVATGECIPNQEQPPYADLGMVVARSERGKGLGSFVLSQLKERCYAAGWLPICSCAADNHASKRAIEKAGFISEERRVRVEFHKNWRCD